MLVLTKKINETIRIGDDITVQILKINGCQVRVGIIAPKSVPIDRLSGIKKITSFPDKKSRIKKSSFVNSAPQL